MIGSKGLKWKVIKDLTLNFLTRLVLIGNLIKLYIIYLYNYLNRYIGNDKWGRPVGWGITRFVFPD